MGCQGWSSKSGLVASVPEFLTACKEIADKVKVISEHRTRFSKAVGNADKETIPERKRQSQTQHPIA